ncbi:MAG: hypothetical protein N2319_01890 [Candidatus Kapabacteria bacterium]|nr:hypothetical protein [Candidatus Kapabacteria bacterium]
MIEEVKTEFFYLERTKNEVNELLKLMLNKNPTNLIIAAASQYVSQFYNGIENILKRILKNSKITLQKFENWHTVSLNAFGLKINFKITR